LCSDGKRNERRSRHGQNIEIDGKWFDRTRRRPHQQPETRSAQYIRRERLPRTTRRPVAQRTGGQVIRSRLEHENNIFELQRIRAESNVEKRFAG
jgi:hypothetical protein